MDDREAKRPKFKQVFSSPSEHYLLEGLPAGWELEAVPRGAGQKHVDYYWLSPPDPSTGKVKRLRSMNEVRSFLNPETAMLERAKRIDHDKEAVRRVVESLIQKVEKRCGQGEKRPGGGGGQGGYRRPLPTRTAAEIMREPLSAFMLFGIEQHLNAPPAPTAEPRDVVRAYGDAWLALSAGERLPFEQMAAALEPARCSGLRARAEQKRKSLASKARETQLHVKTDEEELFEAAATAQLGSGRFAPGGSSYGGRGGGRGRGGRGGGGGKRGKAPDNAYAPQYSGSAARRAAKLADGDAGPSDLPTPPQPEFGEGA